MLQVQLEIIATSVNGKIFILQGCGVQKQPRQVHCSGRAHFLREEQPNSQPPPFTASTEPPKPTVMTQETKHTMRLLGL